jgi:NDP-sugar pyrophosphorylase family protein
VSLPYAEHPLTGVHPDADVGRAQVRGPVWIGPGVKVLGDATLGPYVQLGSGVVVEAGVQLTETIVWPGTRVLRDAYQQVISG